MSSLELDGIALALECCNAEVLETFLCRLNEVIRQNNFFLSQGTPQALELFLLEKEDFLLWFSNELHKAKA